MPDDTTPYEHAFPTFPSARQETPEGEPTAWKSLGYIDAALRSQASPVGEAPRETDVCAHCGCASDQHYSGRALDWCRGTASPRCYDPHRFQARLSSPREETSQAVCERCGRHLMPGKHGNGIHHDAPYTPDCEELGCHLFVPRTSEEPTEGEWRRGTNEGSTRWAVSPAEVEFPSAIWTGPNGEDAIVPLAVEQAIARQAAAEATHSAQLSCLEAGACTAVLRAEAAESRVATLERELADAREALLVAANRLNAAHQQFEGQMPTVGERPTQRIPPPSLEAR